MILTCPECATSYFVPDESIGASGRRVRCHACAHTWRAVAEVPLDLVASPEEGAVAAEPASFGKRDEAVEPAAPELPKAFRARAEAQRRNRRAAATGAVWAGLGCVLAGLLVGAWLFRVEVVDIYPRAASAYAAVGMPVNPTGLEFEALKARASTNTFGQVLISGAVRNVRDEPIEAPAVRVALLDANDEPIGEVIAYVDGGPIAPGAVRGFAVLADDPHARAADIDVAFALDIPAQPKAPPPAPALREAAHVAPAPPPATPEVEALPVTEEAQVGAPALRPLDSTQAEAVSASHG